MILMDLGAEVHGHDHHFKFYEYTKADLSSEIKKKFLNVSLFTSSIGYPKGKKEVIDHSSFMEHHF